MKGARATPAVASVASAERELVKMSVLARLSGVPAATIKHYVREGLLTPSRTSRNMAYYDASFVPRIQRIKELQRTRFLPLKVIRRVLEESPDETMTEAISRVLTQREADAPGEPERRTVAELVRAGLPLAQLEFLVELGVVSPSTGAGDSRVFQGDDLEILRVLGAARTAGLTPEMLPVTIVGEYAQALTALVRAELRLFREGVLPRAEGALSELTEAATVLSERLVVLMRRKILLPTLHSVLAEERAGVAPAETKRAPKPRARQARPARG